MFDSPSVSRADAITALIEASEWQQVSAGSGSKGERWYGWVIQELWRLQLTKEDRRWGHYLLVRRNIEKPDEVAYYVVFCLREQATLAELVSVAGMRWHIESCFESVKGECGLDQYEVRKRNARYRHITLSLLAHAYLSVVSANAKKSGALNRMTHRIYCH